MISQRRNQNVDDQEPLLPLEDVRREPLENVAVFAQKQDAIRQPTRAARRITITLLMLSIGILVLSGSATAGFQRNWLLYDTSSTGRDLRVGNMAPQSLTPLIESLPMANSGERDNISLQIHSGRRLRTVREIKDRITLPCNYVHDGFYIQDSNEIVSQIYQSLVLHLKDDTIPLLIEVGGHDGITKSQSLKASRCLGMNTLLIEASPNTYRTLQQARGNYDWTVNAALCDGDYVNIVEIDINSGLNHVVSGRKEAKTVPTARAKCTTVDAEMDKLRALLPIEQQNKLQLVMLILDVEGFEGTAVNGIQKYSPHKVFMETKHLKKRARKKIDEWARSHHLSGRKCNRQDTCFNFDPLMREQSHEYLKTILYGARMKNPEHTYITKRSSEAYMFYGE